MKFSWLVTISAVLAGSFAFGQDVSPLLGSWHFVSDRCAVSGKFESDFNTKNYDMTYTFEPNGQLQVALFMKADGQLLASMPGSFDLANQTLTLSVVLPGGSKNVRVYDLELRGSDVLLKRLNREKPSECNGEITVKTLTRK